MCGIYGMVAVHGLPLRCPQLLEPMGSALRHRGPDGCGTVVEPQVAFGAKRLRIVDPSPAGDQPFSDPEAKVLLVCNGEIYNAPALRHRYQHYPYRSQSDVETILPLYRDRGISGLADLEGMFALALYDVRRRRLLLARDPAGEKPLFYTKSRGEIWFASEIQALLQPGGPGRAIDRKAALDLLTLGYVREPRTMFAAIRKVGAGTARTFTPDRTDTTCYSNSDAPRDHGSAGADLDSLAELVQAAVKKQATHGGTLGVFASGGLDSTLIAAHAVGILGRERVHLFTAGFPDPSFDETRHAAQLARHLGTEHTVVSADDGALLGALTTITARVAEPVTDPAILPTYLLSREAGRTLKVVMSGEGADELFGGYPTYLGHRASGWFARLPSPVRSGIAAAVMRLPVSERKVSHEFLFKRFVAHADAPFPERHITWFGTGIPREALHHDGARGTGAGDFPSVTDPVQCASLFDYRTYLRDNLLVKLDRATMLCSLEARAPYLDRDVVEFAHMLDPRYKVRGLTTKWALKRVARRAVPRQFVRRGKRGLSVPVGRWLNTTLRDEVDRLLSPGRLAARGLLRAEPVCQLLSEHRTGKANHARPLWSLLMFEYWLEQWGSEDSP